MEITILDKYLYKSISLSGLFLEVRLTAKLRCPPVGRVSAFAKDFITPVLELLQGFQHVVLIQTSL